VFIVLAWPASPSPPAFSARRKSQRRRGSPPLAARLPAWSKSSTSRAFWRYAPQSTLIIGGFLALQGLWAVPWLMNFSGLTREAAAHHLLLMGGGMLTGFLGIAFGVAPLARAASAPSACCMVGMGLGLLATLLIVLGVGPSEPLWLAAGPGVLGRQPGLRAAAGHFTAALAGRVNTALNLMVFVGAFGIQWGFGAVVDALQAAGQCAARRLPDHLRRPAGPAVLASWLWFASADGAAPASLAGH
jgi:hypothetical protein